MANHRFSLRLDYEGGLRGAGSLSATGIETMISAPREMGGSGVGTNPDELLLGAAASCYAITLSAMAARRELPIARLDVASECLVESSATGVVFKRIVHKPTIVLASGASTDLQEAATAVARNAERACMVSTALRGNVQVDVEPAVSIG